MLPADQPSLDLVGTTGEDVVEMELGAVIQDSHSRVDVEMIKEEVDANAPYDEATHNLKYQALVLQNDVWTLTIWLWLTIVSSN